MPVNRSAFILGGLLLFLAACARIPFFGGVDENAHGGQPPAKSQDSPAQAILEFQNPRFDGEVLSGRLLVSVEKGELIVDKRLIVNASVEVESVWGCGSSQPIGFLEVDAFPEPAREDELLTLTPGYWYGAETRFFLFDPEFTGTQAPSCIEVAILYRMENGAVAGRLRIRAEQATTPASEAGSADAGPAPSPPEPQPADTN